MKARFLFWSLLVLLLIVAAALRFTGLDWDDGIGAHPDERYVVGVAEELRWPDRLNPFDVAPDFPYGHLPLYLLMLAAGLAQRVDPLLVGRALAASFDLGTVGLTFVLGRRLYGRWAGLLAAAFVALMVLHVQQAHFYVADGLLAFLVVGALLFAARLAGGGRACDALAAGGLVGLALATKASAALLVLPLGVSCALAAAGRAARWRLGLGAGAAAVAAFALASPFALLDGAIFWHNVMRESAIARGAVDVPYTRQFHATWPYAYPVAQLLGWGMGVALGLVACGGLAYALVQAVRREPRRVEWVLLAWVLPGLAFAGALYAKFPRTLLPLTPLLAVCGARTVADVVARPAWRRAGLAVALLTCCASLLHCLALVSLYRLVHPWIAASEWLCTHTPPGSVVAVEQWDHPLPLGGPEGCPREVRQLPVFEEDTPEKWAAMEAVLEEADYVVIASRRGYAALARWSERYPLTAQYYARLFEGELGFEPLACFTRHPHLGSLVLVDDPAAGLGFSLPEMCQPESSVVLRLGRLDESFVVYDHPQVVILGR